MKRTLILGAALGLGIMSCAPRQTASAGGPVDVTVIGLNDFHGNIEPSGFSQVKIPDPKDATKQVNLPAGGLEVIGGYLAQVRAQNPNTVFVGAGDVIGASPVTSGLLRDEPTTLGLSRLGMFASSLGNHEFDQGVKELLRMQNGGCDSNAPDKACKFENPYPGAGFKWLGANVVYKDSGKPVFSPYAVANVGGAKIGFIGAVLQGTPAIVSPGGIQDVNFLDEASSINKYVPELKAQGVDAIIVLIHQGGELRRPDGSIDNSRWNEAGCTDLTGDIVPIAQKIDPAVTAIISGHTHQPYNCLVPDPNGKPRIVLEGDFYGHLLQRLDLTVDTKAHTVTAIRAANVLMDTRALPKNAEMTALVTRAKTLTDAVKQQPIGKLASAPILKAANAAGESALGDVIADSQLAATADPTRGGAQIAFMNPGGIRQDLAASAPDGTATYGDVFSVQPFGNTLTVMTLTGAQLKTLLEQQFDNPSAGSSRILQVSKGFSYSYDSTAAAGSRVDPASIKLNGQTIDPNASYRVTVNSFLAGGGDNFAVLKAGTNRLEQPNLVDVDAFNAYLKANAPVAPGPQNRITKTK